MLPTQRPLKAGRARAQSRKMKDVDSEMELRDAFNVLDQDSKPRRYLLNRRVLPICN